MKSKTVLFILVFALGLSPARALCQRVDSLKAQVDDLVHKHYFDGIQYTVAHALGPDAIPYLLELLKDPSEKEFWVNIIVTLGFIEDSSALDPLIAFLDNSTGEVDGFELRALLSIPFAVGCIASNGDPKALSYLVDLVHAPLSRSVRWSFKSENINRLLAEQAVPALAVSGRPEARSELLKLEKQIQRDEAYSDRQYLMDNIQGGLALMHKIRVKGRQYIFNPERKN